MPNFRAQQFTATGGLIGVYPNPAQPPVKGGFTMPGALDLRNDGGIVVNDTFNWRIQTLTSTGTWVRQFGTRATFNYARGVAVDPRDNSIMVANSDGQNLKKFNANGQLQWTSTKGFRSFSVDIAPDGTIYAADGGAGTIRVFDPAGTQIGTIGNKETITPRGIEVDPDGITVAGRLRQRPDRALRRQRHRARVVRLEGPADDPARRVRRRHRRLDPGVRRGQGQAPDQGLEQGRHVHRAPSARRAPATGSSTSRWAWPRWARAGSWCSTPAGERIQEVTFTG